MPGENRWTKKEEEAKSIDEIDENKKKYSKWEAAIAEKADIRYGEQENLSRGEGHITMEGICLYLTTIVGFMFIILLIVLKTL